MLLNNNGVKISENKVANNLRNAAMSIPKSICVQEITQNLESDISFCKDQFNFTKSSFKELLNTPHPLIHTWLLLSTISICFLSALFFIFP